MADLRRVIEGELAQVGGERLGCHRLLRDRQGDRGPGLGGCAALRHRQVGELLEQVPPDREDAGGEVLRAVGAPGEVGDGVGTDGHAQTLDVRTRGYVPRG